MGAKAGRSPAPGRCPVLIHEPPGDGVAALGAPAAASSAEGIGSWSGLARVPSLVETLLTERRGTTTHDSTGMSGIPPSHRMPQKRIQSQSLTSKHLVSRPRRPTAGGTAAWVEVAAGGGVLLGVSEGPALQPRLRLRLPPGPDQGEELLRGGRSSGRVCRGGTGGHKQIRDQCHQVDCEEGTEECACGTEGFRTGGPTDTVGPGMVEGLWRGRQGPRL